MTRRAGARLRAPCSRWWRSCIAWYALLALAWPSLGPLPYLVDGLHGHPPHGESHAADAEHAHDGAVPHFHARLASASPSRGATALHAHRSSNGDAAAHVDASSIPGSPMHPDDHNCAECEVLKHLSRCALPTLAIAVCTPVVAALDAPPLAFAAPRAHVAAHLPPVRAPPIA